MTMSDSIRARSLSWCCWLLLAALAGWSGCDSGDSRPRRPVPRRDVVQDVAAEVSAPEPDVSQPEPDVRPPTDARDDVPLPPQDTAPDAAPDMVQETAETADTEIDEDTTPPPTDVNGADIPYPSCRSDIDCLDWDREVEICHEVACDPLTQRCVVRPIADGEPCDDGDPCTINNACREGRCEGDPKDCDDGNVCTGTATCDPETGDCIPGDPLICGTGNLCEEWMCDAHAGCIYLGEVECSDDPCEGIESCDPDEGCVRIEDPFCEDGNPCTGIAECDPDLARAGDPAACTPGEPIECDDGNPCTGVFECDPQSGDCVEIDPPVDCDDNDVCTGEGVCDPDSGECRYDNPLQCDDGKACNGLETCDPVEGCQPGEPIVCDPDGDICTGTQVCVEVDGWNQYVCRPVPPLQCDDGNPCTGTAVCDPDLRDCVEVDPPVDCEDNNVCTGEGVCDPATGECLYDNPLECDDGNPCTGVHWCDPTLGCVQTSPPPDCADDGDLCTGPGSCDPATGNCLPGEPIDCDDGNPCTDGACNPADGKCEQTFNSAPCETGDLCTVDDYCSGGVCQPGSPRNCDDENPCTVHNCHPDRGCEYQDLHDVACDDGDPCTLDSRCYHGECVWGHLTCLCPGNDIFEPNDTHGDATPVEFANPDDATETFWAIICDDDVDFFEVQASAGDRLSAELVHNRIYGRIDFALQLASGELVAFDSVNRDVKRIEHVAREDGPVYFGVMAHFLGDFESFYDLEIRRVGKHHCVEDEAAGNDTQEHAFELPVGEPFEGRACPSVPDWFILTPAGPRTLLADLVVTPPEAPIDFELRAQNGSLLAQGEGLAGRLRLTHSVAGDEPVYLRVATTEDGEVDYLLTAHLHGEGDCQQDIYGPNQTQAEGFLLQGGDEIDAVICPGEPDWFAIDVIVGDQISLQLEVADEEQDFRFYLYRPAGGQALRMGTESIEWTVSSQAGHGSGRYGIRVLGLQGSHGPYTLRVADTIAGTCDNDLFAPNNSHGTGPLLRDGDFLWGKICPGEQDFFRVDALAEQRIVATLTHDPADGDLEMALFNPGGGSPIAETSSGAVTQVIEKIVPHDGLYVLRVQASDGGSNTFRLEIEVLD